MPKAVTARRPSGAQTKFPIACKTWKQVEEIKRKYLKPVRNSPKGQPIYDLDEVARYIIFPKD